MQDTAKPLCKLFYVQKNPNVVLSFPNSPSFLCAAWMADIWGHTFIPAIFSFCMYWTPIQPYC